MLRVEILSKKGFKGYLTECIIPSFSTYKHTTEGQPILRKLLAKRFSLKDYLEFEQIIMYNSLDIKRLKYLDEKKKNEGFLVWFGDDYISNLIKMIESIDLRVQAQAIIIKVNRLTTKLTTMKYHIKTIYDAEAISELQSRIHQLYGNYHKVHNDLMNRENPQAKKIISDVLYLRNPYADGENLAQMVLDLF